MNPSASYSSTELQIKKEKKNTINYKYLICWLFCTTDHDPEFARTICSKCGKKANQQKN